MADPAIGGSWIESNPNNPVVPDVVIDDLEMQFTGRRPRAIPKNKEGAANILRNDVTSNRMPVASTAGISYTISIGVTVSTKRRNERKLNLAVSKRLPAQCAVPKVGGLRVRRAQQPGRHKQEQDYYKRLVSYFHSTEVALLNIRDTHWNSLSTAINEIGALSKKNRNTQISAFGYSVTLHKTHYPFRTTVGTAFWRKGGRTFMCAFERFPPPQASHL